MNVKTLVWLILLSVSSTLCNAAIFNVKDYGATGAGSDDTAAIQTAIDAATAAANHGGTVLFPAGKYRLTATLRIPPGSHGVTLQGEGKTRTVLCRDTDYGSTLIVGNEDTFAIENVTITGLWFWHDYGGYENYEPPSRMLHRPTRGAHIVAYGMTRGKITDCQFWNMPRQLDFVGGSISEVSYCTLRGSWDHRIPELQVTTENMYFQKAPKGIVPSSFRIVHNECVGYMSPPRLVRYGTWQGMMSENVGPIYGLHIAGCEVIQIEGGNIASMNDSAVCLEARKDDALLDVYLSGVFFDGNRFAGVRITNTEGVGSAYNVHINDNTFIGQQNSQHAIWVGASAVKEPPVKGLAIQDNLILNFIQSAVLVDGAKGTIITGNQIRDFNSRGGYMGDRLHASGIYVGASAGLVKLADNTLGGGNSFEPFGAPFNYCEWGISYPKRSKTISVSANLDFGINPRRKINAPYKPVRVAVPVLVGMPRPEAEDAIAAAGLAVGALALRPDDMVRVNVVVSQFPAAGSHADLGSSVELSISTGPTQ